MILQRYTIVKNIAGKIKKCQLKNTIIQQSCQIMFSFICLFIYSFNYTDDQNKNKK